MKKVDSVLVTTNLSTLFTFKFNCVFPSNVSAPALVLKLDAGPETNDNPAVASIVMAAPFISIDPVVVRSISAALPIILMPAAPSKVRVSAVVANLEAFEPVKFNCPNPALITISSSGFSFITNSVGLSTVLPNLNAPLTIRSAKVEVADTFKLLVVVVVEVIFST